MKMCIKISKVLQNFILYFYVYIMRDMMLYKHSHYPIINFKISLQAR